MSSDSMSDRDLVEKLRRLIQVVEISGRTILPSSNLDLLQSIVDAAARLFGAAAASIALVDETQQHLEFKVATGVGNENIVGMQIPLDSGIAGYVVVTGQPVAVSDVQQDPRFDQDFAKSTGYVPSSILAVPLQWEDRVIGVMEVLDKIDEPSFGMQDMELLGLFADQAAIAIYQSQQIERLGEVLLRGIERIIAEDSSDESVELFDSLELGDEEDECIRDLLTLTNLINTIGESGEAERRVCIETLCAFRDYLRSKPSFT